MPILTHPTAKICSAKIYTRENLFPRGIRDIRAKFAIHNSPHSPDIGKISDVGISDFRISGQSLIKENCHNSRTSDNIDMKRGPVTKLDKRNKTASKV